MRRTSGSLILLTLLAAAAGCERPAATRQGEAKPRPAAEEREPAAEFRVAILGDSLTAGLGLPKSEAFPALLEAELHRRGWSVAVINGGVSGDTTAGGKARLGWLLAQRPQVVVIALGANDGLRGQPVEEIASNLRAIARASLDAGARVLLAGMQIPPNYGADYADSFSAVYPALGAELGVTVVPFLLAGVGGEAELNLADGIHPNAAGHEVIAATLLPYLEDLLMTAIAKESA